MCEHENFNFDLVPEAYDETNIRTLVIQCHCANCGAQMRFLGIPFTRPTSMEDVVISTDGLTCSIPMVPEFEEPDERPRLAS